jgi:hypothetical protein
MKTTMIDNCTALSKNDRIIHSTRMVMDIPKFLRDKDITDFLRALINNGATSYDDIDDLHQDKLIAMGIKASDGDIEIILSREANQFLAAYLLSYSRDDAVELNHAIKEGTREQFYLYFDSLFDEIKSEISWIGR